MAVLRPIAVAVCLLLLPVAAVAARGDVREAAERELKAAYLFNIAKFVKWPASAFQATGGTLVIGVLGDPEFAAALDAQLSGKLAQGHSIVIQGFSSPSAIGPCQMLFVAPGRTVSVSGPVLIVGQDDRFLGNGGVINFYIEEETIRFEINPKNAQARGLKISSKLLWLARIVR